MGGCYSRNIQKEEGRRTIPNVYENPNTSVCIKLTCKITSRSMLSVIHNKIKGGEDFSGYYIEKRDYFVLYIPYFIMNAYKTLLNNHVHKVSGCFTKLEYDYLSSLGLIQDQIKLEDNSIYHSLISSYSYYLCSIGETLGSDDENDPEYKFYKHNEPFGRKIYTLTSKEFFCSKVYALIKNDQDFTEEFDIELGSDIFNFSLVALNAFKAFLINRVHEIPGCFTEEEVSALYHYDILKWDDNSVDYPTYQSLIQGYQDYLSSIGEVPNFDETQAAEEITT